MAVQAGLVVAVEIVFRLAHQVEMAVMTAYQYMAESDHQQHQSGHYGKQFGRQPQDIQAATGDKQHALQ